jgi:hypothetical protein
MARRGQGTRLNGEDQGELLVAEPVANLPEVESGKRTCDITSEKAGFDSTTTLRLDFRPPRVYGCGPHWMALVLSTCTHRTCRLATEEVSQS